MTSKMGLQRKIIGKTPIFYGWIMVFVAGLAMFFTGPGQTFSFSIFIDQFITEFGWSRAQVNNYYSLATLISGSTMFVIGKYIDRFGTKIFMIIAAVLLTAALFLLSAISGNIMMLFIGFFLGRFSGQGVLALSSGVLTPHWFVKKRGLALMIAGLGGSIGASFFPKLNLFLINTYGWRTAFQILGLGVLLIFVPICILLVVNKPEDVDKHPDDANREIDDGVDFKLIEMDEKTSLKQGEVLRSSAFWILFVAAAQLSMIVTGIGLNMLSIFREGGLTDSFATTIMSIAPLLGLASTLLMGFFIDKIKKPQYFLAVLTFMQAMGYLTLSGVNSKSEAILYMVLSGLSGATFQLTHRVILPMFFGRRYLGGVSGVITIAWVGGSAIGPTVFGNAYEFFGGYKEILIMMAMIPIISGISLFFAKLPKKREGLQL